MKRNLKIKLLLSIVVICSLMSALYLEFHIDSYKNMGDEQRFAELYMTEKNYLPDVKFLKELLKSFFNVVKI